MIQLYSVGAKGVGAHRPALTVNVNVVNADKSLPRRKYRQIMWNLAEVLQQVFPVGTTITVAYSTELCKPYVSPSIKTRRTAKMRRGGKRKGSQNECTGTRI
jgi:hypothetical protein